MDPEFLVLAWQMALKRDDELLQADEFLRARRRSTGPCSSADISPRYIHTQLEN
jgi:hypothetical protein